MARLVHDGLSEGVFKAENAKAVGNEKFQAGGFADALDWYDRSLKLIDDVLSTGVGRAELVAEAGGPQERRPAGLIGRARGRARIQQQHSRPA